MAPEDPSVSDLLGRLGYGHRGLEGHPYARRVFRTADGEHIADFGAWQAADFCRALEAGLSEPDARDKALSHEIAAAEEARRDQD